MQEKLKPIFGDSALSLRNKRTTTFSFSKANRFGIAVKKESPQYVLLPSTLNRRGTSLGYGGRWQPDTPTKENPCPGAYEIRSSLNTGHGLRYREDSLKNAELAQEIPGPGTYNFLEPFGKDARKIGFRTKHCDVKYSNSPSPNSYSPKNFQSLVGKGTNFGYGQRQFMRHLDRESPGPGCYDLPSSFQKFVNKKK